MIFPPLEQLAPGVTGYTREWNDSLYIPYIRADREGNGDVGRYLDSLPTDRRVVVPCVISKRLEGMLKRRGFTPAWEWSEYMGEHVEIWERS